MNFSNRYVQIREKLLNSEKFLIVSRVSEIHE